MTTLVVQIHPDHLPLDGEEIVRDLSSLGAEDVERGTDTRGHYINVTFETRDLRSLWESVRTKLLVLHPHSTAIAKNIIAVATGQSGWDDYLLLHHYDQKEKIDYVSFDVPVVDQARVLRAIEGALKSITNSRFFETERGFQGEFVSQLHRRLPETEVTKKAIVEQEYQKRTKRHGINIRPDIVIHIPTAPRGDRTKGNYVAIELKLAANRTSAKSAFTNLDLLIKHLAYPLGVFVNVASIHTFANVYKGPFANRLHFFAVSLDQRRVHVCHSYFRNGKLVQERMT